MDGQELATFPRHVILAARDAEAERILDAMAAAALKPLAECKGKVRFSTPHMLVQPDDTHGLLMTVLDLAVETTEPGVIDAQKMAEILGMRVAVDTGQRIRLLLDFEDVGGS